VKSWTESKTIKYLVLTFCGTMLLQLVPMLQNHVIDWWALGAQSIGTLAAILIRMAQDDVEAPVGLLNKKDPQP
jgi:hypothetical protein